MHKLQFNIRIPRAISAIRDSEAFPFIDLDGTRYLFNVSRWHFGMIIWTPFDIETQSLIGNLSYSYPYAAHNILRDAVFGPNSKYGEEPAITTEWPDYPIPTEEGMVTP